MTSMITTLGTATSKNPSLRTTVPAAVVKQLHLKKGSKLDWMFDKENGIDIVVIRPLRTRG